MAEVRLSDGGESEMDYGRIPVKGYGVRSVAEDIDRFDFSRRPTGEDDVQIQLLACGICHSDIHHAYNEWHDTIYPVVPGHEMIGLVTQVGINARNKFKVGDRVAVGNLVGSCRQCKSCQKHKEQYCENGGPSWVYNGHERSDPYTLYPTGELTFGGYSEMIVVNQHFVLHVPANLDTYRATPLLCAGITVYSPLIQDRVAARVLERRAEFAHLPERTEEEKKIKAEASRFVVGVAGIGGLGHLAVMMAKAMGAYVIAFTTSAHKFKSIYDDLGANWVIDSKYDDEMRTMAGQVDIMLDTIPHPHSLDPYLDTLAIDGKIWVLGVLQEQDKKFNVNKLNFHNRSIAGSTVGGIQLTQEMFDFCANHQIQALVEKVPVLNIRDYFDRVRANQVLYRFVLLLDTFQ